MKKRSLIIVLSFSALLLQFCKKSDTTDTTTTTSTVLYNAYVNAVLWTPKTITTTLTYNATNKTKVFTCTAVDSLNTGKIVFTLSQAATAVDSTITVQTYSDTTSFKPMYYTIANGVATPSGSLKGGYLIVSAIDVSKKLITGTFGFTAAKYNYDSLGNIVSISSTGITAGQFNSLPYTFKKQ